MSPQKKFPIYPLTFKCRDGVSSCSVCAGIGGSIGSIFFERILMSGLKILLQIHISTRVSCSQSKTQRGDE